MITSPLCYRRQTKSSEGRNLPKAQGVLGTGLAVAPEPGEGGGMVLRDTGWALSLGTLSGHWHEGSGHIPRSPAKEGWREASCL